MLLKVNKLLLLLYKNNISLTVVQLHWISAYNVPMSELVLLMLRINSNIACDIAWYSSVQSLSVFIVNNSNPPALLEMYWAVSPSEGDLFVQVLL